MCYKCVGFLGVFKYIFQKFILKVNFQKHIKHSTFGAAQTRYKNIQFFFHEYII